MRLLYKNQGNVTEGTQSAVGSLQSAALSAGDGRGFEIHASEGG